MALSSVPMALGPYPGSWTVARALEAYLAENGFTLAEYDSAWTSASFFGLRFAVPNTARHRWAIMLHDLHHVATGYGTDLAGEAEISGWELRRGLGALGVYVASIVTLGALMGVVIAPRRALAAVRQPVRGPSLFERYTERSASQREADYRALLALTVDELRDKLRVPASGIARTRRLHGYAPAVRLGA